MSPYKDPEVRREKRRIYDRRYYKKNKEKIIKSHKEHRQRIRSWFIDQKKQLKCEVCGISKWYLLVFHHIDPSVKNNDISTMVRDGNSKENIMNEIKKCKVLCCNCHTELHHLKK